MTVYLVGAGPGDPGLITARGLELLRGCEAVVYDVLVAPELVDEVPAGALRLAREGLGQHELNELLVSLGRDGIETVRLKGGDPFVFGRGGEEMLALQAAGVAVEVVPGVSALSAVPGAIGVPLTQRGLSAQVTLVSGQSAQGDELDYRQLAVAPGTLVVFMGLARLPAIVGGLLSAGKDPTTPAAVVSRGTLRDQEAVRAELQTIVELASGLASPALLVVGEVVALAELLAAPGSLIGLAG